MPAPTTAASGGEAAAAGLGEAERLVLASGSPRRLEMLERLGVEFEVRQVDIDETPRPGEPPDLYVERLAAAKARAARRGTDREVILAADTTVALDGEIFGKPRDETDARRKLERLQGRRHEVLTGVAVLAASREPRVGIERTAVRFAELSEAEIAWYVETGEPLDKAGAYAIQGFGALFVEAVDGNYSNVVGLPLPLTYRLLRQAGWSLIRRRT